MTAGATPATVALDRRGVAHRLHRYDHDPRHPGGYGDEAAQVLGVPAGQVLKTLVVALDGGPLAVAVVPVAATVGLKAVAAALGAKRATMAEPRDVERVTGYVVGGVSPLGQRRPLPAVLDASILALSAVFVSGGRRGLEIELAPADLVELTGGILAPIAVW